MNHDATKLTRVTAIGIAKSSEDVLVDHVGNRRINIVTLRNKALELITEADRQSLKENKVREAKVLEYKSALPGHTEQGRKVLYNISSFRKCVPRHEL